MNSRPSFKKNTYGTKIAVPVFPFADLSILTECICDLVNECSDGEGSLYLCEKLEHAARVLRKKHGSNEGITKDIVEKLRQLDVFCCTEDGHVVTTNSKLWDCGERVLKLDEINALLEQHGYAPIDVKKTDDE